MISKKTPLGIDAVEQTLAETFGQRLKIWRTEFELTQAEFAAMLDIHVGMLKKYEAGRSMPSGEVIGALLKAGVSLRWLYTGTGDMEEDLLAPRSTEDAFHVLASGELEPPDGVESDAKLKLVFQRLVLLMVNEGPLFWMPRTVTQHQCHMTARWAVGLIRQASGYDEQRGAALMLQDSVIDAALCLGWKAVQFK